ncbi:phage virion morphogenesis protein [Thalassolituus oleivorans]|uniref:phage virion morphogenesis protein n=1 Tax=Thalassolituus oleivorans TaxID=187493 RepID=UPI0023F43E71|nr:phage virion morphogenesis protein [Thalassolituus oleivorans]
MIDDIEAELKQWLAPYLQGATATGRREFARAVSRYLYSSQSNRIRDQKNPDGTPFEARKKGKKAMFEKLRKRPNLRSGYTDSEVWVGFRGPVARIADVHQNGLLLSPAPGQQKVRYAKRELLGYTAADIEKIKELAETTLLPS